MNNTTQANAHTILLLASIDLTHPSKILSAALETLAVQLSDYLREQDQQNKSVTVRWYTNHAELAEQLGERLRRASCPEWVQLTVVDCDFPLPAAPERSGGGDTSSRADRGFQVSEWLEEWHESLAEQIERDINQYYPAALEMSYPEPLETLPVWYFGLLPNSDLLQQAEIESLSQHYAELLPSHHHAKAQTWLTLLLEENGVDSMECWLDNNEFFLRAVALANFLHAFDEECGNGHNNLGYKEAIDTLPINCIYLGAKLSERELLDFDVVDNSDHTEIAATALELVIESDYRRVLKNLPVFSSDSDLFFTLWSSTWPDFHAPSEERISDLLNDVSSAEKLQAYNYVSEA